MVIRNEFSDPPNIKNFSDAVERVFQLFRNACNVTLDYENEYFEKKINLVRNCREKFRSIAKDTIKQSDELAKFGGDIMILVEYHNDEDVSDKDLLDYLDRLLNDAKTNKTAIEETNSKIKTFEDDMARIYNEFAEIDFENMKNIDPTTYNELNDAEFKKKFLNVMSTAAFIVGGIYLVIALPTVRTVATVVYNSGIKAVTGLVADAATEAAVLGAGALGAASTGKNLSNIANDKKNEAAFLQKILSIRQKQMTNKSAILQNNIISIIPILEELEGFWKTQIVKLENLISQLRYSHEHRSPFSKLVIKRLEKRWKEAIEECKCYSDTTRNEVNNDMNNSE